jgi:uncharacterized membrane protein
MLLLLLGLVLFLGVHSVRIVAEDWRNAQRTRIGANAYKGLYSLVSAAGLVLIIWGFGAARGDSAQIWLPPGWLRHAAALLVAVAFVLVVGAYVPANRLKAKLHHPMILGVKTWAVAHLLANGRVVDVVLFGAFLVWAVIDFSVSRRRDRATGTTYPPGRLGPTLVAIAVGLVAWAVFGQYLHGWLFGVRPFGPS